MESYAISPSALPVSRAAAPQLALQPATARYEVAAVWEQYANGDYQRSTTTKQVVLSVQHAPPGTYEIRFETSAARLTKPQDRHPLEQLAERLATLYQAVTVQAKATGEVVALLNHEELQHTWAALSQELRASTSDEDAVTHSLLAFVERQLQSPTGFLESLQQDYLYQMLLLNRYQQPLAGSTASVRTRRFLNFFDKTPLCFAEHVAVQPGESPGQLLLQLRGTLDARQTDVDSVQSLIAKALHAAQPPAATPPLPAALPAPHFAYEAEHVMDQLTGLPVRVELTVYARAGEVFNKQYTLTLTRL